MSNPVPVALVLALGSAWITTSLGLHPVFGGLMVGLTMRGSSPAPDADVLRSMDQAGTMSPADNDERHYQLPIYASIPPGILV